MQKSMLLAALAALSAVACPGAAEAGAPRGSMAVRAVVMCQVSAGGSAAQAAVPEARDRGAASLTCPRGASVTTSAPTAAPSSGPAAVAGPAGEAGVSYVTISY